MARSTAAKGRAILNKKEIYPEFNLFEYDKSLRENLFFYNTHIDDNKKKKEWALTYWKSTGKDVTGLARFSDGYFSTIGAVAHMIHVRDIPLNDIHFAYLETRYEEFKSALVDAIPEDAETVRTRSRQDVLTELERECIGDFLGAIDGFFSGEKFDAKSYLIQKEIKSTSAKRIADALKPTLKEIRETISKKDEQLVEAYSYLSVRQLKKFEEFVSSLISSCDVAIAIVKASRKPRTNKVKPATEIVKIVKYLLETTSPTMKSEHPSKIVNSTEVWVYNAKNRRLFRYVALSGTKLTVKGTTIINVDVEKSGGKIIRKPEVALAGIQNLTSRPINKLYNGIRGTESKATGRLNGDTLIVKSL